VRKSAQGVEVKGLVATDAAYEKILDWPKPKAPDRDL